MERCWTSTLIACAVICMAGNVSAATMPNSSGAPEAKRLTWVQAKALTSCAYVADEAEHIAIAKLRGLSHQDARARAGSNQQILEVIDTVYGDPFDNELTYTAQYYQRCAMRSADAPSPLLMGASEFCLQNALMADTAAEAKRLGIPIGRVYDRFNKFLEQPAARKAIDTVYAEDKIDGQEFFRSWAGCVGMITDSAGSK